MSPVALTIHKSGLLRACEFAETIRGSTVEHFKGQLHILWRAILQPEILLPAAFIFLWQVIPVPTSSDRRCLGALLLAARVL